MIVEQGEVPASGTAGVTYGSICDQIHCEYEMEFCQAETGGAAFDPVRKVMSKPTTRFSTTATLLLMTSV